MSGLGTQSLRSTPLVFRLQASKSWLVVETPIVDSDQKPLAIGSQNGIHTRGHVDFVDYVGVTIVAMGYEAESAASTDEKIEKCRIIAKIPRKQILRDLPSENVHLL